MFTHAIWRTISGVHHSRPADVVEVGGEIQYYGEVIAVIAAETKEAIKEAKAAIVLDITPTKAILSIDDAKEAERFIGVTRVIERGDLEGAFERSKNPVWLSMQRSKPLLFRISSRDCVPNRTRTA